MATYFEKKLAFACGIVASGTELGTLIMAPLINFLDNHFGWSQTFMMLGVLLLVCIPLGLLFEPISDSYESERTTATYSNFANYDGKTICTRLCSSFMKPQIPKFPNILYDTVFTIMLFANFLANIGFPVAYSYTVVSMSICVSFSCIYISYQTELSSSLGQCIWE